MSKLRIHEKVQEIKPFTTLIDYRKDEYLSDRQILKKLEKEFL